MEIILWLILGIVIVALVFHVAGLRAALEGEFYLVGAFLEDSDNWTIVGVFKNELDAIAATEGFHGRGFVQPFRIGKSILVSKSYYPQFREPPAEKNGVKV